MGKTPLMEGFDLTGEENSRLNVKIALNYVKEELANWHSFVVHYYVQEEIAYWHLSLCVLCWGLIHFK